MWLIQALGIAIAPAILHYMLRTFTEVCGGKRCAFVAYMEGATLARFCHCRYFDLHGACLAVCIYCKCGSKKQT